MPKNILIILVLAVSACIFFAGCSAEVNKSYHLSEAGVVETNPETEEDCAFDEDCPEGFECFKRQCISYDIIESMPDCKKEKHCYGSECVDNHCPGKCENCEKERISCMHSQDKKKDMKCVECFTDFMCKEGFSCRKYKCVPA